MPHGSTRKVLAALRTLVDQFPVNLVSFIELYYCRGLVFCILIFIQIYTGFVTL